VQLSEPLRPEDLGDPQLGRSCLGVDRLLQPPSFGGELDHASPAVRGIGYPQEVPTLFQVPEQIVDRLFGDSHPVCKLTWPQTVEARMAPEPDVRGVQIVVSRGDHARIQLITDPLPNDPKHGAEVWTGHAVRVGEGIA
jgi:hypothetical protein